MKNKNTNKNGQPARLPTWPARRQHRRLSESARIYIEDLNSSSVTTAVERTGILADPVIMYDGLHRQYFTRGARHRRLNLIWVQLEVVKGQDDSDAVADPPRRARNGAHRVPKEA